jgi:hypothetical protein
MKLKSRITKGLAILFLLMLSQKFGGGLFLHCVWHISEKTEEPAPGSRSNTISYACNCIDDFSSPFDNEEHFSVPASVFYADKPAAFYKSFIPSASHLFHSLRAPPVTVA